MSNIYSISRNGRTMAVIEADDVQVDGTGDSIVMVFIKGDKEARVVEDNSGDGTPYVHWQSR